MEECIVGPIMFKVNNNRVEGYFEDVRSISMGRESTEKLRDWLTEALKPRYEVNANMCENRACFIVRDTEWNEDVALYKVRHEFDAKAEARKLCKQLNETF